MTELVIDRVDVASQLWEDGNLEILVFEIDGAVGLWLAAVAQIVQHRIGIDRIRIDQGKWRIRVGCPELIRRNRDRAFPAMYRLRMRQATDKQEGN